MKITHQILHIPPYISTAWHEVRALYLKGSSLVISLAKDILIEIPDLKPEVLEIIFNVHSAFLEEHSPQPKEHPPSFHASNTKLNLNPSELKPFVETVNDPSIAFSFGSFDSLGSALHHDSRQSHLPDLPEEMLSKIASIAKIIAPEEAEMIPKPEPHCNCTHCQIARAVHQGLSKNEEDKSSNLNIIEAQEEEEVTDADLSFQQWNIKQTGDKLFSVINRLDTAEIFSVYLGHPVGCTCGQQNCEHILAVLKS